MALLSNRRGGLGLLAIGPSGVRRAANERRASYMAAPRAPAINASPGRPIMVDNPINGLFEGMGTLGKSLGEYGEFKKAQAQHAREKAAMDKLFAPQGVRNDAMQRFGGPTPEAAAAMDQGLAGRLTAMGVPARAVPFLQSEYEAGNYDTVRQAIGKAALSAPAERKTSKDVNGVLRYEDTGEQVFRGIEKDPEPVTPPNIKMIGPNGAEQSVPYQSSLYYDLVKQGFKPTKAAASGGFDFGSGAEGSSMSVFAQLSAKQERGETLTGDEMMAFKMAQWRLSQPRVERAADGSLISVQPQALPAFGAAQPAQPQTPTPPAPQAAQPQTPTAPQGPQTIVPGKEDAALRKEVAAASEEIGKMGDALITLDKAYQINEKTFGASLVSPKTKADLARRYDFFGWFEDEQVNTTNFDSLMLQQVLPQLKLIFGGNPTEGENKLLQRMQASAELSIEERKVLLEDARELLVSRFARAKEARALLDPSGKYWKKEQAQ